MSNSTKSLSRIAVTASIIGLGLFAQTTQADEAKKADKMITRFSAENKAERLKKLEELKKAHHEHIDELYTLKAKHVEELAALVASADLKDEKSKNEFGKMFREKNREFKKIESELASKFRKEKLGKMGGEFKKKMKERRKDFKEKFKGEKKEKRSSEE